MNDESLQVVAGIIIESNQSLTMEDICNAVRLDHKRVRRMVEDKLIKPQGMKPEDWLFDEVCLRRARLAASFHRDLGVNMAGVGLALDLIDKIDRLEEELHVLRTITNET